MVLAVAHDAVLITTHAWTADPIADVTVPHAVGTLGVTGIGSVASEGLAVVGEGVTAVGWGRERAGGSAVDDFVTDAPATLVVRVVTAALGPAEPGGTKV